MTGKLGMTQIGIIVLTLATGLIHLIALGIPLGDTLFILNGLGYLGLLGALYLPLAFLDGYRIYARWALLGFAVVTIVAYFIVRGGESFSDVLGLITKAIEVALVVLLYLATRK
jgi:hypothetical protein